MNILQNSYQKDLDLRTAFKVKIRLFSIHFKICFCLFPLSVK